MDSQQQVCYWIEIHKLTKCKLAIELSLKSKFMARLRLRLFLTVLWMNIKIINHLKATKLPHCFTASSGMFMVTVNLTNTSFFCILLCRSSFPQKPLIQGLFDSKESTAVAYHCSETILIAWNTFLNSSISAVSKRTVE